MQWMELIVHTTTEAAELIAELLEQAGAKGASIEDRNDLDRRGETAQWDIVDADVIEAMPEDVLVHAYFPVDGQTEQRLADACARLDALASQDPGYDVGSLRVERKQVDDTDWAEHWKQYYKPFRAGKALVVKPTWEAYDAAPGDLIIEMDPGMAFGTGTHETTALCMELLERWQKPGDVVMDVGCGSGILAIAAALLSAKRVLAVDIDPMAVRVARENIAHNGLEDRVRAVEGDLLAGVEETADLMVANIIASVIIQLAQPARAHVREGGLLLCSGIIKDRADEVRAALEEAGFALAEEQTRGEWVAMAARAV